MSAFQSMSVKVKVWKFRMYHHPKKDHVLAYWCAPFQQCQHWSCGLLHLKHVVWKRNGIEHWSRNVGKPSPNLSPANPCQLSAQLHLSTERCRQSNLLHISNSASEGAKNKPPLQTQKAHHLSWHSEVRPSWNPLLDPQKNVFRSPMSDMRSLFPSSLSSLLPCDLFSKPPFISPSLEDHASPKEKKELRDACPVQKVPSNTPSMEHAHPGSKKVCPPSRKSSCSLLSTRHLSKPQSDLQAKTLETKHPAAKLSLGVLSLQLSNSPDKHGNSFSPTERQTSQKLLRATNRLDRTSEASPNLPQDTTSVSEKNTGCSHKLAFFSARKRLSAEINGEAEQGGLKQPKIPSLIGSSDYPLECPTSATRRTSPWRLHGGT